jgi:hypothetical protein
VESGNCKSILGSGCHDDEKAEWRKNLEKWRRSFDELDIKLTKSWKTAHFSNRQIRGKREADEEEEEDGEPRFASPNGVSNIHLEFNAYDCGVPEPSPFEDQIDATYTILQRAEYTRFTAQRCKVTVTEIAYVCGMHGHTELAPKEMVFNFDHGVGVLDCAAMWATGSWSSPRTRSGYATAQGL